VIYLLAESMNSVYHSVGMSGLVSSHKYFFITEQSIDMSISITGTVNKSPTVQCNISCSKAWIHLITIQLCQEGITSSTQWS